MVERTKVKVTIDKVAQGGDGVGRLEDGRVIFVPKTLPGEVIRGEVLRSKKSFARGRVLEVVSPSAHRVEAQCAFFVQGCGGCQFWHTSYAHELEIKTRAAYDALERISKVELPEFKVTGAPSPRRYRNRVTFHWRDSELGFFVEGTRRLIEVVDCPITEALLIEARRFVEPALKGLGESEIVIELAGSEQVVVSILPVEGTRVPRHLRKELERLVLEFSIFRGFIVAMPAGDLRIGATDVMVERTMAKPPAPGAFVPAGQFRQVNDAVNALLVDHVREAMRDLGARDVLELFAGTGNFAFALQDVVASLVGVEGNPVAIATARDLAKAAGVSNLRFEVADLSEGLEAIGDIDLQAFDTILLDPPRQGAHELSKQIAEARGLKQLVYISCDPPCLGRDLQVLAAGGYKVRELHFFDMFPRTAHIETVAVLER